MRTEEYEDDAGELGDLVPPDMFDQIGQAVVAQIRTAIEHRASYAPVDGATFADRDIAYYDAVERELSAVGFETVGDYEDTAILVSDPSRKSFVRFATGAHGAIAAMWFEVPAQDSEGLLCLVLHSWLADGRVLVTTRGTIETGLPLPANVLFERLETDVDTRSALRTHGERVAATGAAPCRLAGADEMFARYAADETAIREFRRQLGVDLFEPMLRASLGPNYDLQGEPILDAIRRHPEWLEGEISNAPDPLPTGVDHEQTPVDRDRFPHLVIARIPEHIEPMDRGARYEDPLQDALAVRDLGMVTGGASQLTPATEIGYVDIELALADLDEGVDVASRILEEAGAPVGSRLLFERDGDEVDHPFGVQEGLALYLDGTSLPDDVYAATDINALMERLASAVDSVGGELRGVWSGPGETAFYHYGPSADAMAVALQPVFDEYPICQNARLIIRQGLDGDARAARVTRRNGA
jgi:hypothetical protein